MASQYVFEHGWQLERRRMAAMEAVFDPNTIRQLTGLGVPAGGRCLEVGAGAGSIARWLARAVGPEGRVVATDLEIDFLGHLEDEPNIEVRRHDIVEDDLEEEVYDLVHARLVLEHIPERELCLKRLCTALAPGGLLVLEDFDWGSASPINEADRPLFDEVLAAAVETFRSVGYDDTWARRMFGGFREAGLVEVGAEGWVPVGRAGTAIAEWWQLSLEKLRPVVLARTSLSDDVFERYMDMVSAPDFAFVFLTLITAWGRRPGV